MKIGIVAEGPADIAVLMNILHGKLGVERKDVLPIRPELTLDETDLAERRRGGYRPPGPEAFSNWALVLEECCERTKLADFLDSPVDEDRSIVIHIDTAEAGLKGYDVERPERRGAAYVESMRARVVALLESLLGDDLSVRARFAVAVEETDAWLLTLFEPGDKDTGSIQNPKKKLEHLKSTGRVPASGGGKGRGARGGREGTSRASSMSPFEAYFELSARFRDPDALSIGASRNKSLQLFVGSLGV